MDKEKIKKQCDHFLNYHPSRSMKQISQEVTNYLPENMDPDAYGEGKYIEEFQNTIAELLGKEAAIFFPSGTMAQQITLRVWCQRQQNFTVAMHPTAHLEFAEHLGYQYLHNIRRIQFGAPEYVSSRQLTLQDFENLKEHPGVILLELPQRVIGYQLPEWDELIAITSWAKDRQIPLHLDGARLWECQSFYQKPISTISQLFDSVYVSFYKGLGGICGAALAGTQEIIDEVKVWQRRMGGNLVSQFPFIASAKLQLETRLNKMSKYYIRAREVASFFKTSELVELVPDPPHSNSYSIYFKVEKEKLQDFHYKFAQDHQVWIINRPKTSLLPSYTSMEVVIGDNALRLSTEEWEDIITQFLDGLENLKA